VFLFSSSTLVRVHLSQLLLMAFFMSGMSL
jgi:hypothetical protein